MGSASVGCFRVEEPCQGDSNPGRERRSVAPSGLGMT